MKILIDSDALFALFFPNDASHEIASAVMNDLEQKGDDLYITNLVLQESATVISSRLGQKMAKDFLNSLKVVHFKKIFVDETLTERAWKLFNLQNKKGTSFIDCSNVVIYRDLKLDKIFSFDKFYKQRGVVMIDA